MKTLTEEDLRFVATRLPNDVYKIMANHNIFVGGGFIRETIAGGTVKDIDIFVGGGHTAIEVEGLIKAERPDCRAFSTDNAITILSYPRLPVQIITRWMFIEAEKLVQSFDFTVCQCAIWRDANGKWVSMCHDDFYSDLAARRLVYTFPDRKEDAGGSLMRVKKFLQRGYNIQPESLAGVVARVSQGITATEEKEFAKEVRNRLREVDPLVLGDGMEMIDEHQLINQQGE